MTDSRLQLPDLPVCGRPSSQSFCRPLLGVTMGWPNAKLSRSWLSSGWTLCWTPLVSASKSGLPRWTSSKNLFESSSSSQLSLPDLAQVAGKIISMSPAVAPAALYTRAFFQSIKGSLLWNALFPNPAEVRETLQFRLDNLDSFNGRPWWPQPISLWVTVDAWGVGFGGILTSPSKPPLPFQGAFTAEQAKWSSYFGEVLGYIGAVSLAAKSHPSELTGSSILVTGDNQGAVSCINNLRSLCLRSIRRFASCFGSAPAFTVTCWHAGYPETVWQKPTPCFGRPTPRIGKSTQFYMARSPGSLTPSRPWISLPRIHPMWRLNLSAKTYNSGCTDVDAYRVNWVHLLQGRTAWIFSPVRGVNQTLSLLEA
jgi:hypothetical protein